MYHMKFKGTHYEMGYQWGDRLYRHGRSVLDNVPFPISQKRLVFARKCRPLYESWYPEVLEEIRGIADGQRVKEELFEAVLLSMYCIMPENKCSCFAFRRGRQVILARNSDFLTELEKLYMNCIYRFKSDSYSFLGNTTAFVEMEDGVNEHGLAIGLTSVYPKVLGYGLNAGLLLRYGLERCKTVEGFIGALKKLPVASSQTFTAVDRTGAAAVIECNAKNMELRYADEENPFVSAVNAFHFHGMEKYRIEGINDWNAGERYETLQTAFRSGDAEKKDAVSFAVDVLKGEYGFICQYDRRTGKDTVWSAVYDVMDGNIFQCEGNPARKKFVKNKRFKLCQTGN